MLSLLMYQSFQSVDIMGRFAGSKKTVKKFTQNYLQVKNFRVSFCM